MLAYFNGSGKNSGRKQESGFTLMELIIVIIIMGVMSVGIAGFIKLSTQTYLNVTERDELLANARFAVERLNREIRNAVPNSVRVANNSPIETRCLEFVPIIASTVYSEIPVAPESAANTLTVIPFQLPATIKPMIIVYPLSSDEIYQDNNVSPGKTFLIKNYPESTMVNGLDVMELENAVQFSQDSPTKRAYIFNTPVSYCLNGETLKRYEGYGFTSAQRLPPLTGSNSLMAEGLDFAGSSFTEAEASLERNAVIQIKLNFTREGEGEEVLFDNSIHITNIP